MRAAAVEYVHTFLPSIGTLCSPYVLREDEEKVTGRPEGRPPGFSDGAEKVGHRALASRVG